MAQATGNQESVNLDILHTTGAEVPETRKAAQAFQRIRTDLGAFLGPVGLRAVVYPVLIGGAFMFGGYYLFRYLRGLSEGSTSGSEQAAATS